MQSKQLLWCHISVNYVSLPRKTAVQAVTIKDFIIKIIITTLFAEITGRSTDNPGFHALSVYTSDGFLR